MLAVELLKYRQLHCVEITWVLTLVGQETKGYTSKKKLDWQVFTAYILVVNNKILPYYYKLVR